MEKQRRQMDQVKILERIASIIEKWVPGIMSGLLCIRLHHEKQLSDRIIFAGAKKRLASHNNSAIHSSKPVMIHFKAKIKTKLEGKT